MCSLVDIIAGCLTLDTVERSDTACVQKGGCVTVALVGWRRTAWAHNHAFLRAAFSARYDIGADITRISYYTSELTSVHSYNSHRGVFRSRFLGWWDMESSVLQQMGCKTR